MTEVTTTTAPRRRTWRDVEWWWLGYLLILLFPLVFGDARPIQWFVTAAAVVVFLPLCYAAYLGDDRTQVRATIAVMALGVAVGFFNSATSVFLVYAAAMIADRGSDEEARRWLVAISITLLAATVPVVLGDTPPVFVLISFLPSLVFVWIVGVSIRAEVAREREAARLRVDNARIEHLATATERERIARDLHDLLGHTLTSVVVRAQLVQRVAATDAERAATEAAAIEEAARDALGQVRGTLQGWRQANLDEELEVAGAALAAAGVAIDVRRDPSLHLAPSVETALALALREGVTNVVRHAAARRCTVRIGREDGEVRLRIDDDGRGGGRDGGGLTGMRERIVALGGRVERTQTAGTRLTIALPAEVTG